ncbi:MAG TPA: hypothetical protein VK187_03505 [Geobacteraceae bacterium]|nr:hypothetical protein [Geobacteraceae bacterium]
MRVIVKLHPFEVIMVDKRAYAGAEHNGVKVRLLKHQGIRLLLPVIQIELGIVPPVGVGKTPQGINEIIEYSHCCDGNGAHEKQYEYPFSV